MLVWMFSFSYAMSQMFYVSGCLKGDRQTNKILRSFVLFKKRTKNSGSARLQVVEVCFFKQIKY
jgi:hypothetical protein